jgi:hypothetical protein
VVADERRAARKRVVCTFTASLTAEVQIRDGDFLEYGERCLFHEKALKVAADLRADLERDGWASRTD